MYPGHIPGLRCGTSAFLIRGVRGPLVPALGDAPELDGLCSGDGARHGQLEADPGDGRAARHRARDVEGEEGAPLHPAVAVFGPAGEEVNARTVGQAAVAFVESGVG